MRSASRTLGIFIFPAGKNRGYLHICLIDKRGVMRSKKVNIIYQYLYHIINSDSTEEKQQLPSEKALSERFNISRPTIHKALNILEEEGYIYRKQGAGIFIKKKPKQAKKGKYTLGLMFPLLGQGEIFRPIADEITTLSNQLDFNLIWGGQMNIAVSHREQMKAMVDFYISQKVDGIIMAPDELTDTNEEVNRHTIEKINIAGIPLVLLDGDYVSFPDRSAYDLVGIDNFQSGYMSTAHFFKQGTKRVDFCLYSHSAQTVHMRIKGYRQAIIDFGLSFNEDWIHIGNPENIYFVKQMIKSGATNIICGNDNYAFNVIKQCRTLDIKVPQDLRVTGFDDLEFAKYCYVPLTTIAQPCKDLGRVAIETMISRIKTPLSLARKIMLSAKLIERESSIIPS